KAITLPGDKGLMGEECTVLVPLTSFSDLLTEQAAARRYGDVKGKKFDNGCDALEFYSPSGTMTIVPHPLMKRGEALLYPTDSITRTCKFLSETLPGIKCVSGRTTLCLRKRLLICALSRTSFLARKP